MATPVTPLLPKPKPYEGLVIILAIVLIVGSLAAVFGYQAYRDEKAADRASTALQTQVDANAKQALSNRQAIAEYADLTKQLLASNLAIRAAQKQSAVTTQKQQAVDQTLPPPELAARWTTLIQASPEAVQPSTGGYTASQAAAVSTVTQLEKIPELQSDISGDETIIANDNKQITDQGGVVTALQSQITGLNVQIADQTTATAAQIKLINAQNRKSKLRWFGIGFVAGFVAREIIKP